VEQAGRGVQALLREGDRLDVFGVAPDQGLTAEEQGQAAGPFVGFTVFAMVLLVGSRSAATGRWRSWAVRSSRC
jgi:hypothetical protein